jgi:hypothetical protein
MAGRFVAGRPGGRHAEHGSGKCVEATPRPRSGWPLPARKRALLPVAHSAAAAAPVPHAALGPPARPSSRLRPRASNSTTPCCRFIIPASGCARHAQLVTVLELVLAVEQRQADIHTLTPLRPGSPRTPAHCRSAWHSGIGGELEAAIVQMVGQPAYGQGQHRCRDMLVARHLGLRQSLSTVQSARPASPGSAAPTRVRLPG